MNSKMQWIDFVHHLQNTICQALEITDGKARFKEDIWQRAEGGGGITRVLSQGDVFEKGGVNTSVVFGEVTDTMRGQLNINGTRWFASGLSLVIHPVNPFVPTVHCNYRMFEVYDENDEVTDRWFGGGTDLTPYYLFEEDAVHFHQTYKEVCDKFDPSLFKSFKENCDNYFVNHHRNEERRGIGGIFYDHEKPSAERDLKFWMNLAWECGYAFTESYIPIVEKRKNMAYNEAQKYWQEIRRGRYTEFNLVHDKGTLFGLKTQGRIESILMSLPPTVRFDYNDQPEEGSAEAALLEVCLHPKEWV